MTHTKQSKARFWCFLWFKIMLQTKRSNTSALSSYILQKEINPFTKELPSSSKWRFFMVEKGECFIKSPLKTTNRKEKTKQNTSFHLLRTCMAHTCRDFFSPTELLPQFNKLTCISSHSTKNKPNSKWLRNLLMFT